MAERAPKVLLVVALAVAGGRAGAQQCTTTRALVAPSADAGLRIGSVRIDAAGPPADVPGTRLLHHLHRDTRPARIRQELLFAEGDALDTLRVAESMHRLRALGFLDQVELEATRCDSTVDLVVRTRDTWSATPELKVRSSTTTVGFNERNVLGTGVGLRVALQSGANGVGVQAAAHLPGLPLAALTTELGTVAFTNGRTLYASLGTRTLTTAPTWTLGARIASSEREPRTQPGTLFDRSSADLIVGRRIAGGPGAASALYALGGAEVQRADLAAAVGDVVLGPRALQREYAGAEAGVARVATRFDTLSWLLPRGGVADVPRGVETELVSGVGRDRVSGGIATHWDGWVGRVFAPAGSGTLVVGDAWASGYAGDDLLRSSTVRAALSMRRSARRGGWSGTLAGERLQNPDPDVRALASLDPLAPALHGTTRLAEAALSSSVERTVHLHAVTRSLGVDGALFAAGTYRWSPAGTSEAALGLGAVGVGLRLAPLRTPRATVRLDVGVPIVHTAAARGRPYVALTLVPWLFDGRQRDGRRLP